MKTKVNFSFLKEKIFNNKIFLTLLIILNLFSAIIAIFYYYKTQLISSSPIFWFFILDCPIFAFLFAVLIYKKIKNKQSVFLTFFVLVGVLKYSLWTMGVIIITSNIFSDLLIFISHLLFLLQIIIFYKKFSFKVKHVLLGLILFLIFDFFDYVFLTHPYFNLKYFNEVMVFSVFLSFFAIFLISIVFSKNN